MIISIFEQTLIFLPLILGAYLILSLLKLPDFSIESAYLFGAVMAYLAKDLSLPIILLSSVFGGMIVGTTVSMLSQVLRIPFLIAAIVTNGLFHGFTQFCLGTSSTAMHLMLPISENHLLIAIAITLIAVIGFMSRSELGYSFAIYGNNPQFFRQHGLSTKFVVFSGILLGHGCAAISGFLFAQSNGFVDLTMNYGVILMCLTALMFGKLYFFRQRPNLLLPLVGTVCFFLVQQSLLRLGLNLKYFNAFQAMFVLAMLYAGQRKTTISLDHLGV